MFLVNPSPLLPYHPRFFLVYSGRGIMEGDHDPCVPYGPYQPMSDCAVVVLRLRLTQVAAARLVDENIFRIDRVLTPAYHAFPKRSEVIIHLVNHSEGVLRLPGFAVRHVTRSLSLISNVTDPDATIAVILSLSWN